MPCLSCVLRAWCWMRPDATFRSFCAERTTVWMLNASNFMHRPTSVPPCSMDLEMASGLKAAGCPCNCAIRRRLGFYKPPERAFQKPSTSAAPAAAARCSICRRPPRKSAKSPPTSRASKLASWAASSTAPVKWPMPTTATWEPDQAKSPCTKRRRWWRKTFRKNGPLMPSSN